MDDFNKLCLDINNLSFFYQKGEDILKHISLQFDEKSTAIIGQNGAGKTTFVKLLKGLLKPTDGTICFEGRDISQYTVAQLSKHIGMVFQNPNDQIFKNTVLEEVMFGPLQIGMDKENAREKAMEALEKFELKDVIKENPYDLLLSERKLIAIASILAMDTKVIILDEPTIAQDFHGKELIKKAVFDLKKEGKTVITIIHDMDFVAEAFDRAVVFAKGNILLDGSVKEVFAKEEILKEAYLEQPNLVKLCKKLNLDDIYMNLKDFMNVIK